MADEDDANVFRPDAFWVRTAPDSTDIHLVWARGDERLAVALGQSELVGVLLEVQKQIAPGSGVPINLASFRARGMFSVTGFRLEPRPDHFALTAYVELPGDRTVTVPLRFSRKDVEDCVTAMTRWLSHQG